ncbi:MAG: DUF6785 family protein [Armatimonadota bacterium]
MGGSGERVYRGEQDGPARRRPRRVRLRALVLGAGLVPLNVLFMVWGNWTGNGVEAVSLVAPAVAGVFVLSVANRLLIRRGSSYAFTPSELVAVYCALAISTGLCASVYDWGGNTASVMSWPVWNATPSNHWEELLWPNLPSWLLLTDAEALSAFYRGASNPYRVPILLAWLGPSLWWTAWATALLWVSLCLNVIVRRRWSQEEQLPFPMTVVPLQVSQETEGLFGRPLFWTGVAVAGLIGLSQSVATIAPAFPVLPTSFDYGSFVANNKPWDATRIPHFSWGPWQLGLSYMMPVDLALSLVVFNLFWRAELISTRQLGWSVSSWGGFPYGEQQVMGGYLALAAVFLALERRYLVQVLRKALGLRSHADDSEEAFSYRTAVAGALAGVGFIWWFLARAGMAQAVVAFFVSGYFLMVMMMTRLRAQLGPPSNEMWGTMPDFALTQYPGTQALGPRSVVIFGLLQPFLREQTANPAPTQLETLRMAQVLGVRPREFALLMGLVVPLGMMAYFWATMHMGSRLGLGSGNVDQSMVFHARRAVQTMEDWLMRPAPPDWGGVAAIGVGSAVVVALMGLKLWLPFWPLHPVAFPLGFDMMVDDMLPALAVTWLTKSLLLRYGGLRAHRRALPLFVGLIVGGGATSFLRAAISGTFGIRV